MPDLSPDPYIQLIRFRVAEGRAAPLMQAIFEHLDDWVSACDGFISSNFHVSGNGRHVINYAQWRDQTAFDGFLHHPRQPDLADTIAQQRPERVEADSFALVRSVTS